MTQVLESSESVLRPIGIDPRSREHDSTLEQSSPEEAAHAAEAIIATNERRATAPIALLRQLGWNRAQIEYITSYARAQGHDFPEDDTYLGHDEVMNRVAWLGVPGAETAADIRALDSTKIHTAFEVTSHRKEMTTYHPDNPYFQEWLEANKDAIVRDPSEPWNQEFIRLYADYWNSDEAQKNSSIIPDTSKYFELPPLSTLPSADLYELRADIARGARGILYGDAIAAPQNPDVALLDSEIDQIEVDLQPADLKKISEQLLRDAQDYRETAIDTDARTLQDDMSAIEATAIYLESLKFYRQQNNAVRVEHALSSAAIKGALSAARFAPANKTTLAA